MKRWCVTWTLGCFRDEGPFDYLDLLPSPPEEINTKFLLYTRERAEKEKVLRPSNLTTITSSHYNSSRPTKLLIHGFGSSCYSVWIREMRVALLTMMDVNIICVNWEKGAEVPNYVRAASNTRLVGRQVALLIEILTTHLNTTLDDFHLIGFSLGAHVSGQAGARLKNLSRISGLDPAGPLFESYSPSVRLDHTDARFVDVIHTNADSLLMGGLGAFEPMGHVDFYPNGGRVQKGCDNLFIGGVSDILWPSEEGGRYLCNHRRGYKYYLYSVAPACRFPSFVCRDYETFLEGECFPCQTCGNMGYFANLADGRGELYLVTRDTEPFCANQYKVTVYHSSGGPTMEPVTTYGRLDLTFIATNGINETLQMTRSKDTSMAAGGTTVRILVPHPALTEIRAVQLRYTAYQGWIYSGFFRWALDKLSLMDSFGNTVSFCHRGTTLVSGKAMHLSLLPGDCSVLETSQQSTHPALQETDNELERPVPPLHLAVVESSPHPSHPGPDSPQHQPSNLTTLPHHHNQYHNLSHTILPLHPPNISPQEDHDGQPPPQHLSPSQDQMPNQQGHEGHISPQQGGHIPLLQGHEGHVLPQQGHKGQISPHQGPKGHILSQQGHISVQQSQKGHSSRPGHISFPHGHEGHKSPPQQGHKGHISPHQGHIPLHLFNITPQGLMPHHHIPPQKIEHPNGHNLYQQINPSSLLSQQGQGTPQHDLNPPLKDPEGQFQPPQGLTPPFKDHKGPDFPHQGQPNKILSHPDSVSPQQGHEIHMAPPKMHSLPQKGQNVGSASQPGHILPKSDHIPSAKGQDIISSQPSLHDQMPMENYQSVPHPNYDSPVFHNQGLNSPHQGQERPGPFRPGYNPPKVHAFTVQNHRPIQQGQESQIVPVQGNTRPQQDPVAFHQGLTNLQQGHILLHHGHHLIQQWKRGQVRPQDGLYPHQLAQVRPQIPTDHIPGHRSPETTILPHEGQERIIPSDNHREQNDKVPPQHQKDSAQLDIASLQEHRFPQPDFVLTHNNPFLPTRSHPSFAQIHLQSVPGRETYLPGFLPTKNDDSPPNNGFVSSLHNPLPPHRSLLPFLQYPNTRTYGSSGVGPEVNVAGTVGVWGEVAASSEEPVTIIPAPNLGPPFHTQQSPPHTFNQTSPPTPHTTDPTFTTPITFQIHTSPDNKTSSQSPSPVHNHTQSPTPPTSSLAPSTPLVSNFDPKLTESLSDPSLITTTIDPETTPPTTPPTNTSTTTITTSTTTTSTSSTDSTTPTTTTTSQYVGQVKSPPHLTVSRPSISTNDRVFSVSVSHSSSLTHSDPPIPPMRGMAPPPLPPLAKGVGGLGGEEPGMGVNTNSLVDGQVPQRDRARALTLGSPQGPPCPTENCLNPPPTQAPWPRPSLSPHTMDHPPWPPPVLTYRAQTIVGHGRAPHPTLTLPPTSLSRQPHQQDQLPGASEWQARQITRQDPPGQQQETRVISEEAPKRDGHGKHYLQAPRPAPTAPLYSVISTKWIKTISTEGADSEQESSEDKNQCSSTTKTDCTTEKVAVGSSHPNVIVKHYQ